MNNVSRLSHALLAAALLALAAPLALAQVKPPPKAAASTSLKAALSGTTWKVVSTELTDPKGLKREIVVGGPSGGQLMLGANGRYSYLLIAELPKLAKDRIATTPAEDKMVSQGVLASYGTYTIDDNERILTLNVERSSFPNQNGQSSKRAITLKGDEMTWDNPARMSGGSTRVVFKKQ